MKAGGSSRLVRWPTPGITASLPPRERGGHRARLVEADDGVLLAVDHQRRDRHRAEQGGAVGAGRHRPLTGGDPPRPAAPDPPDHRVGDLGLATGPRAEQPLDHGDGGLDPVPEGQPGHGAPVLRLLRGVGRGARGGQHQGAHPLGGEAQQRQCGVAAHGEADHDHPPGAGRVEGVEHRSGVAVEGGAPWVGQLRRVAAAPHLGAEAAEVAGEGGDLVVPLRGVERERVEEEEGRPGAGVVERGCGRGGRLLGRRSSRVRVPAQASRPGRAPTPGTSGRRPPSSV